jgi:hypothetical protein
LACGQAASSLKEAVDRFEAGDFDLVILCRSTAPASLRNQEITLITRSMSAIAMFQQ